MHISQRRDATWDLMIENNIWFGSMEPLVRNPDSHLTSFYKKIIAECLGRFLQNSTFYLAVWRAGNYKAVFTTWVDTLFDKCCHKLNGT